MKQFIRTLTSIVLIATSLCLFSCDNDPKDFGLTGKNGLPSSFKIDNQTIYLSYAGNRLQKIMHKDGSTSSFTYEGDELLSIFFAPPADPNMADGHGAIDFKKEGNKIRITQTGEPSLDISYDQEIELDENELPVKITDLGTFQMAGEGEKKLENGKNYSLLTFDPSTKNLLKLEKFNLEDSTLIASHTFKYDNQPGSMCQIKAPAWFFSYWFLHLSYDTDLYSRQYLNYHNTLTEETVTEGSIANSSTIPYKYMYNENGYPVSVDNGKKSMKIKY